MPEDTITAVGAAEESAARSADGYRRRPTVTGWVIVEIMVPMLPALLHISVKAVQHGFDMGWSTLERETLFGPELPFLSILLCSFGGLRLYDLHQRLDGRKRTLAGVMGIAYIVVLVGVVGGLVALYGLKEGVRPEWTGKWIRAQEVLAIGSIVVSFLTKFFLGRDQDGWALVD